MKEGGKEGGGKEGAIDAEANSLDLLRAVIFIIILTSVTIQTTQDLRTDTDPLSDLELRDLITDMSDFSNNLMSRTNPFSR